MASAFDIRFYGQVPQQVETQFLNKEYNRICDILLVNDRSCFEPLSIIFYKRSEIAQLGIRLPEWGGGGALGRDSIFIPVDVSYAFFRSDLNKVLTHEMVHIVISRKYGNIRVPRWFHEGMAMALSGEIDSEAQIVLSKAVLTRSLVHLDSIKNVNRFTRDKAHLAYAQSHYAVQFLLQKYGQDLLVELLEEIKKRYSFDAACLQVFGLTSFEIDTLVRKEIKEKYHYLFFFEEAFLWYGILLLAITGFIATIIRKKIRRKEMEQQEMQNVNDEDTNYDCNDNCPAESRE